MDAISLVVITLLLVSIVHRLGDIAQAIRDLDYPCCGGGQDNE